MSSRCCITTSSFLLSCIALLSFCDRGLAEDASAKARVIYEKAASVSFAGPKAEPFELHGEIEVGAPGATSRGTFRYTWNNPRQWRTELILPEYHELRIGTETHYWRTREPQVHFLRANGIFGLLRFRPPRLYPEPKPKKAQIREEKGQSLSCIQFENSSETCFDNSTGFLISSRLGQSSTTYSDYRQVAGMSLPFGIVHKDPTRTLIVRVVEVTRLNNPEEVLFTKPTLAKEYATCDDPIPPRPLDTNSPYYPLELRRKGVQGTVEVEIVVDTTGKPSEIAVVRSVDKRLDAPAAEAVSRWRFRPAMCGSTPIEREISIQVQFRLP